MRYRKPVFPGDVVEIEATVLRLRNRMGLLRGVARVNGERVVYGSMTFALAPPQPKPPSSLTVSGPAAVSRKDAARFAPLSSVATLKV